MLQEGFFSLLTQPVGHLGIARCTAPRTVWTAWWWHPSVRPRPGSELDVQAGLDLASVTGFIQVGGPGKCSRLYAGREGGACGSMTNRAGTSCDYLCLLVVAPTIISAIGLARCAETCQINRSTPSGCPALIVSSLLSILLQLATTAGHHNDHHAVLLAVQRRPTRTKCCRPRYLRSSVQTWP
jgi:hypothetical protein